MMTENTYTVLWCVLGQNIFSGLDASAGSVNTGIGLHTDIFQATVSLYFIAFDLGPLKYCS